jgi:predicted permease
MRWLYTIPLRVRSLMHRAQVEQELEDELQFHIDELARHYTARGLTPDAARRAALRDTHSIAALKDRCRETRRIAWIEDLVRDVLYARRTLIRNPTFAVVTILTLALGIGANTAIFSLVNGIRAGALPYGDPERLVELWGNVGPTRLERRGAAYPDFQDWRARARSFEDVAAFDPQMTTLTGFDEPERISAEFVSASYFPLLKISPSHGRTFLPEEDLVSKPAAVVVMSDTLWRRRFGADPNVVGQTIGLRGGPFAAYTVVGVMPFGFRGLSDEAELWLPFALWGDQRVMANRSVRGFGALARLRSGTTIETAQQEIDRISVQLQEENPATNAGRGVTVSPLDVELFGPLRPMLLILMGAVVVVFLIACANVTNLLIARMHARTTEMGIRTALGASRGRLLRQFLTESCVLASMGGVLGLAVAGGLARTLMTKSPVTFPSFVAPDLDWRVALVTILMSLVAGVLVGVGFGLQPAKDRFAGSVNHATPGIRGTAGQHRRQTLVVVEISLAVVSLSAAGLLVRSVQNLAALHPGFNADQILTLHLSRQTPPGTATSVAGSPSPAVVEGRVLLEHLRGLPGVEAASISDDVPFDGRWARNFYAVDGQPPTDAQSRPSAYLHRVSPEFFSTLQIPLVRGRTFNAGEAGAASGAVIVSENLARRFWPDLDPIGKRLKLGSIASDTPWLSIVGVAGEVKYRRLRPDQDPNPDIYVPFLDQNAQVAIAIRTTLPPASLSGPVRGAVRAADSSIAVSRISSMDELMEAQTATFRFLMWLMSLFAGMAVLLAVIGIYGVVSYTVQARTREIGIRMALGARRSLIMASILWQSVILAGIGIGSGLIVASAVGGFSRRLLMPLGASNFDAATLASVALLFAVAATIAATIAAHRAPTIDPIVALRCE